MLKVMEVRAEPDKGREDATNLAIQNASESVRNIKQAYIEGMDDAVADGRISKFREIVGTS